MSFSFCLLTAPAVADECEIEIGKAARKHAVPVEVLQAVGETETGRGDGLRPNALNIAGQSYYDLSREQARRLFTDARQRGIKLIDVGCMQINHHYHKQHFASVSEILDPARNVDYAARFLRQLYDEEQNWTVAVARYHAGKSNHKAQRRYVCTVIRKLVSAGRGVWTRSARAFCGETRELRSEMRPTLPRKEENREKSWAVTVLKTRSGAAD